MSAPPYTNLTGYATRVTELVPDAKGGYTDSDFVKDALERYAEAYPCWEQADIGDGSTTAWLMGTSPFAGFLLGYSDLFEVRVEELSASASQRPQVWMDPDGDYWLERRTVSGAPKIYLVFLRAPATTGARVHWRRRWTVTDSPNANEVPLNHQEAVVFRACAYKCSALASWYRRTVDPGSGSDYFAANDTADAYAREAKRWEEEFRRVLAVGVKVGVVSSVARHHRQRVFDRRLP
jgi:hypothetical protein